jgi:hypothetical protein
VLLSYTRVRFGVLAHADFARVVYAAWVRNILLVWTLLFVACTGSIDGGARDASIQIQAGGGVVFVGGGGSFGGGTGVGGGGVGVTTECRPLEAPLRTLTARQFDNVVRVLLKDNRDLAKVLELPASETRFDNHHEWISPNETLIRFYSASAEKLAAGAVARQSQVFPCSAPAVAGEASCIDNILNTFARKAYRRTLTSEEKMLLKTVFTTVRTLPMATYDDALAAMTEVILQSPQFLYFTEVGTPIAGKLRPLNQLTPLETASKLALFLWGSIPDETLLDAAENNRLNTVVDVTREARRILLDPQATQGFLNFGVQWLDIEKISGVQKNAQIYPHWSSEIPALALSETQWLLETALKNGSFVSLMESPKSQVKGPLASLYGLPASVDWTLTDLPATERAGVLTRGAFLASHAHAEDTSPTLRGKAVRTRFLCEDIPPPPPNVNVTLPTVTGTSTLRTRLEAHLNASTGCAGCHRLIDPIGFGFERYDGTGKYRLNESNGLAIDARGEIVRGFGSTIFNGPLELSTALAHSADGRRCFVTQLYRFAQGRNESSKDRCHLNDLSLKVTEGTSIQDTLVQLVTSQAFLSREPLAQ